MTIDFQNTTFIRYFWGFMSLYVLNCTVDCPNVNSYYGKEDLTYNDQESIIEIFVEKILGFEDAIAENEDNDIDKRIAHKTTILLDFFVLPSTGLHLNKKYTYFKQDNLVELNRSIGIPYFEIHTPPPEV
ncbi:hypothetical protein [Flavobacterium sandaracinum]|uniref:Uncharacterized protein n=1 Tax=Flavobacterium sandaracinum TaxID=2541733 RepID=A0A4R5D5M9_9FLAO|nr:hypothetical protein [Flavobacterium sandaracinum]TDE06901.1 hypothetical protein E0F91_03625 [Flavobacterium sandaracinum]